MYQEGYQTNVTVDTELSNQVEEDNVDDEVPESLREVQIMIL